MQKLQGYAQQGGVNIVTSGVSATTEAQGSFPGCTVTVYKAGTVTLASIYSDNAGTPKANPFTAGSDASWSFYARAGSYDVKFSGTGITTPFTLGDFVVDPGDDEALTPQMFAAGTIGDGTSRALSTVYGSLAAAQADYSFITSLTQTLDYAAIQKMSYEALGYPTVEHGANNAKLNRAMFIPCGTYRLGSSIWSIKNGVGVSIKGGGMLSTQIWGDGASVLRTDGFWYSTISEMTFLSSTPGTATVDIDGDSAYPDPVFPDHTYATRGVQQISISDVLIDANGSTYALAITRQGNAPGAQGAQGSSIVINNCKLNNSTFAGYFSTGFNPLGNVIFGGDLIGNTKYGVYINGGCIAVYGTTFESTVGYTQVVNDGYDIAAFTTGVNDRIVVAGCRTEGIRFYKGSSAQFPVLIGNYQTIAADLGWTASAARSLNEVIVKNSATLGPKLYRVTTAGTSGGSEPTWPDSGTVADGSVVWTLTNIYAVDLSTAGSGTLINNGFSPALNTRVGSWNKEVELVTNTATSYTVQNYTKSRTFIFADTTTGNQTINLGSLADGGAPPDGTIVTVKKVTTDANTVTVASAHGNGIESAVIPGGATGAITLQYSQSAGVSAKWWVISRHDNDPSYRRLSLTSGSNLAGSDFALSAGWGSTASVTSIETSSKDSRGAVTVTSAGTGQAANPTMTLTFKNGAWPAAPFAVVCRGGGSQLSVPVIVDSITTTTLVIRFIGTPVAAETYIIRWFVEG